MHLHWERSTNTAGDCNIRSMSWMGRVPDEIPQDEGWKLNRVNYYQEGWLSTANLRGVVGVTYTTSHCGLLGAADEDEKGVEPPQRTNYNLRGHLFEVTLVCWNEPYQKLATCDTSGVIFVWIKYEGRWSIELINDRHTPVICFSWSHDGRMALICYQDGFVLVGSVAGQRYWSTILPIETQQVTSGIWTPDDQFVYMGTSQGEILVMDLTGNMVNRVVQKVGVPIVELAWNCERFNMEEQNETATHPKGKRPDGSSHLLAVCHKDGEIHLIHSYDDILPQVFNCGFQEYLVDWTNSGEILAVAGKERELTCKADHSFTYINSVLFYNDHGALIYKVQVPSDKSPVTAMTWGHNDKRLFVATGNQIHVAWVSHHIASLQLLSRLKVHRTLANADQVQLLPLPCRIQNLIGLLFTCTIRSSVPSPQSLRDFAIRPHPENVRLYCTMVRHGGDENVGSSYTLYLEHLGGFLPLLKGKKVSKLRPDFVIYDPAMSEENAKVWTYMPANHFTRRGISLSDPNEVEFDGDALSLRGQSSAVGSGAGRLGNNNQGSPRNRRRQQRRMPQGSSAQSRRRPASSERNSLIENTECVNLLPEDERLAEVTSNFWGTKFQITSSNIHLLPLSLGEVTYKASLLHLQPRQMRLEIIDLLDDHRDPFGSAFNLDDDENEESDLEDSEFDQGVVMKDDILRAVKANADKGSESSCNDLDSDSAGLSNMNIAPIAPLPTRLSFCLTPRTLSAAATPCANNESTICEAILREETEDPSHPIKVQRNVTNRKLRKSPVKTVVGQVLAKVEGIPLSQNDAILEDIHDSIEAVPCTSTTTGQATSMAMGNLSSPASSPSKRLLRMSVSCDNYLSEAKFALSRRDSVGSGSPHSSKGSPRRWAAKADEITRETEMSNSDQVMAKSLNLADLTTTNPWQSNSANELDMIVDLLGVPSDLLGQQDLSKRLILLGDKKPKSKISLDKIGKSASCDDEEYPKVTIVNGQKVVRRRRKKRLTSEADKKRIEVKRQSIYAKNCRGRSETKSCQNCDAIAMAINDADLNKEIFDVPSKTKANLLDSSDPEDNIQVQAEDQAKAPKFEHPEKPAPNGAPLVLEQIKENIPSARQSREPRRFDGVRNILEKARGILLASSRFRSRSKSKESPQETLTTRRDSSVDITLHLSEDSPKMTTKSKRFRTSNLWSRGLSRSRGDESVTNVAQNGTQSSPNTPLQMRKARNRSFSPVRALLNSPLLRRKKIPHPQTDSSEEDLVDSVEPRGSAQTQPEAVAMGEEFRNLETFQKQKLRDKLKRINPPEAPGSVRPSRKNSTSNLNPTPSSTPQFLSPFLSRRGLALRSPNLSLSSRRDYLRNLSAPPPVKVRKRRKLVLRNKSPMWNDTSQVYQLDFGGRVTLESAKNFQIEYKDTQVMQFGRIDTNAYTLDFQYPFTAIQAFGVALANVTQRLK